MTNSTLAGRTAILALTPFRRFADRTGEGGAFLMMGVPLFTAYSLLSVDPSRIRLNMVCFAVMAVTALAIFARHQDGEGHRAMRRLMQKVDAGRIDPHYAEGLAWLKLPASSGVEDIKAAVRALMKRHHADTGAGGLDMAKLVAFRDRMVGYAEAREVQPAAPGRVTLLIAYERAAGRLGCAWGHMFPTQRLKDLGYL